MSQHKTDHCHEPTLKQLSSKGGKTRIAGPPAATDTIRSWKYFDSAKLIRLQPWQPSSPPSELGGACCGTRLHRIPIPAVTPDGSPGELTLAFLPEKNDITGLHNAIGITYQPPSIPPYFPRNNSQDRLLTPPHSPSSLNGSFKHNTHDRPLSVLYSPHGCTYATIAPYASSHLVSLSGLPLTLLLHCFDQVSNPWYLGGNICTGLPGGQEIAKNLGARCWVGAHDGDKDIKGLASKKLKVRKWAVNEVQEAVSPRSTRPEDRDKGLSTQVVALDIGEEMTLTRETVDYRVSGVLSPTDSGFASSLSPPSLGTQSMVSLR